MRAIPWLVLLLLGCDPAAPGPSPPAGAAPTSPGTGERLEMPVPSQPNGNALSELLAATPSAHPQATGPDGGTRVATDTGREEGSATASNTPTTAKRPRLKAGRMTIQPRFSSAASERAAREQIYWALAQKCKGPDGNPPPPDSILLKFTIRADGSVHPASVEASSDDPSLEATAECVLREFSALPFRGPAAARDSESRVIITWPSVD